MFPSRAELRARIRRIVATHAAIGGGLVGGALVAAIASRVSLFAVEEWMGVAAAAAFSTAVLSSSVVAYALEVDGDEVARRAASASMVAAVANVPLALYACGLGTLVLHLDELTLDRVDDACGMVVLGVVVGGLAAVPGLVVSVPLGALYAIGYAATCYGVRRDLGAPALRSIARAHGVGSAVLVVSAAICGVLAVELGAIALVPAGALAFLALGDALVMRGEEVRLGALEAELRAGLHPTLVLCDPGLSHQREDLAAFDGVGELAIVARAEAGPAYRSRPEALAML